MRGPEWRRAADNHIAFYASELAYGNPLPVPLDAAAREHARQYLAKGKGDEAAYRAILANAEKNVAKLQRLADMAPDYVKVMAGPAEVNPAFSPDGWSFCRKGIEGSQGDARGFVCDRRDPVGRHRRYSGNPADDTFASTSISGASIWRAFR